MTSLRFGRPWALAVLTAALGFSSCGDDDDADTTGAPDTAGTADTAGTTGDTTDDETTADDETADTGDTGDTGSPALPTRTTITRRLKSPDPVKADFATNPSFRRGLARYLAQGMGTYTVGEGDSHLLREGRATASEARLEGRKSLSVFVHLSDLHVCDGEAPLRLAALDNPAIQGALRPQEDFMPQTIDAMTSTIRAWQDRLGHIDFAIFTGDNGDNAQLNETRWFVDLLDGGRTVNPDSGAVTPNAATAHPEKVPFTATGLNVPWFGVLGNHDVLISGFVKPDEDALAIAIGNKTRQGTRDYDNAGGDPVPGGAIVAPDPDRKLLTTPEIIAEILRPHPDAPGPGPAGHGFTQKNVDEGHGNYVTEPIPGFPLRLIVLDTNDPEGGSEGRIEKAIFDAFIKPELQRAADDDMLVMISSHHPDYTLKDYSGQFEGEPNPNYLAPADFIEALQSYPNVLMRLAGHTHENRVGFLEPPTGRSDLFAYWQVETASLVDFPQQARFLEFVLNGDDTLSVYLTLLDYETERHPLAEEGRKRMFVDYQAGWSGRIAEAAQHRNVELLYPVPTGVLAKLKAYAAANGRDEVTSLSEFPKPQE
jgi:hypothetical protein